MPNAKVRLFVDHPVGVGQSVPVERGQAHYLFGVMRLVPGDRVLIFNQTSGEWLAEIVEAGKKRGVLACVEQTRPLRRPADVWLLFAPIKKERTDFIVEKATELGASLIQPVRTARTQSDRVKLDRLRAHAIEATEQCGGTFVPELRELVSLEALLESWPSERKLMFCDEGLSGAEVVLPDELNGPTAILIGPEGGFSEDERARLAQLPFGCAVSLGPRILRADTAAVTALTLWQAQFGDWG